MSDPVPAVTEAEATGDIAAIFADIRAVYRVGVVNLIWRHLATIPGALPWTWATVRPIYVNGTIAHAAATFRAGLSLPRLPRVPPEVFAALGLSPEDCRTIGGVLAAYDRTNSMALIALMALRECLVPSIGRNKAEPATLVSETAVDDIPLPALTPLDMMPPSVVSLVVALNRFGARRDDPILASMYRHLSHWPPFLGLGWAMLAPLHQTGVLQTTTASVEQQAKACAAEIAMQADPPPAAIRSAIDQAIEPFTSDVLPKMVAICAMLRGMTADCTSFV